MKIKKFRAWNYKSIIDSHDCFLSPKVTILAGKNESGKTSLLEALEDFNIDKKIRSKSIPIQNESAIPQISVWFTVSKIEINDIFKKIGIDKKYNKDFTDICVDKKFPDVYSLDEETIKNLGIDAPIQINTEITSSKINPHLDTISAIYNAHPAELQSIFPPVIKIEALQETIDSIDKFISQVELVKNTFPDPDSSSLLEHANSILDILSETTNNSTFSEKFLNEFKTRIPNFILFSSFNDIFPNTLALSDLDSSDWIKDLSSISDLDKDIIKSDNDRKKREHKTKVNVKFNNDFKRYWIQDLAELSIDWDNEKLLFWIEEDGFSYEPEIRSQGKRWYLAFYIKITARSNEKTKNVLLIDEPGLYLHATAQKDVLNKLEKSSEDSQIIFSTHSPYLIEADKLERIRLVYRDSKFGTIVENKIHKIADKETLTPILTAIGLEMASSISQVDRLKNVIVEGPSDYYYLQSFKRLYNLDEINIMYGGGAGNMPKVGTILQGWGCNVIYLYDSDQGYKNALKNIKEDWLTTTQELISKIPVEGAIEDIFSTSDYKRFILLDERKTLKIDKNSEYAKRQKRDKVLDSKLFLESLSKNNIILESSTKMNALKIFKIFEDKFKNENGR